VAQKNKCVFRSHAASLVAVAVRKPIGTITRGTTNPNRLRRIDRFIASQALLRQIPTPIVVDLGFGASPITAVELLSRLRKVNSNTHVVGIEIDRERVERGVAVAHEHLHFTHGGFETPLPSSLADKADVIRAFNVLRQYEESEVAAAWAQMQGRLSENGILVEGTCDEIGRLSSWVTLDRNAPLSLTISLRLLGLDQPSKIAERLPKVLIHRNTAGERIHEFLLALDLAWQSNAGIGAFSPAQRWVSTCKQLVEEGWPLIGDRKRWRLGELTIEWSAVAPRT
jgi:hypothetical protein